MNHSGYGMRAALAAFLFAALACAGAEETATLAIVDCTLIDGTGARPVPDAVVLIRDGVIQAAGGRSSVGAFGEYPAVSLHGAYLLPGFINAHVHSHYSEPGLRLWLSSGVTSVRDLGYLDSPDNVERRDALAAGRSNARLIAATPLITHAGGYGGSYVDGPASARAAVRRYVKAGFDLVKIALEDDLQGRSWPMMSGAEARSAVAAAHAAGKKVSAHVSHVRNLPLALEAGVDDLAHMVVEPLPEELARTIAARGILWVPTLELWQGVSERHSLDWIRTAVRNTEVFRKAGGRIALGTDYNGYSIPFDDGFPITEVNLLLAAGLSPMEVIVAGTRNAAEVCGRAGDLGTVEKGKIADLLAVRRNPLEDVSALQDPVQVFKSGVAVLAAPPAAAEAAAAPGLPPDLTARFDRLIPGLMKEQRVPGLAVAVTDGERTLWSRGYGWTDDGRGRRVTPQTMFAVLPISTALTATAVMIACREGLVDLDTPITAYLPEFTVNSVFEDRPERSITLRNLLNHTSGLAHEAPHGNNFDLGRADFRAHVDSISATWLRFPVGRNWAYSNLGIDLAGRIIERRSGLPFARYVQERLLAPLGMSRTTLDPAAVRAETDRASGHAAYHRNLPVEIPMIPAGGVYTSAEDLAKFVRLHLDGGGALVEPGRLRQMYAPSPDGLSGSCGLGIAKHLIGLPGHVTSWGLGQAGGGFGFLADMYWYPEIGIGAVVLTNSMGHGLQGDLVFQILNSIIDDPRTVFHERLKGLDPDDPEARLPPADPARALRAGNEARFALLAQARRAGWHRLPAGVRRGLQDPDLGAAERPPGGQGDRERADPERREPVRAPPGALLHPRGGDAGLPGGRPRVAQHPARGGLHPAVAVAPVGLEPAGLPRGSPGGAARAPAPPRRRREDRLRRSAHLGGRRLRVAERGPRRGSRHRHPPLRHLLGEGLPPVTAGVPPLAGALLRAPAASLLLTLAMLGICALAWAGRRWSRPGRLYYSILSGGAALSAVVLAVWRLV